MGREERDPPVGYEGKENFYWLQGQVDVGDRLDSGVPQRNGRSLDLLHR